MNQQQFVEYYIRDLSTTADPSHNRSLKVRQPEHWKVLGEVFGEAPTGYDMAAEIEADNVVIWSDLHFGHNNIIKYSNRPFETKEHMGNHMVAEGNKVAKNAVMIFNGDLVFGGQEVIDATIGQINGYRTVHVIGNHDINKRGQKAYNYHMDHTAVCMVIHYRGRDLYFTHYPMETIPSGGVNIHGHTHQWKMEKPNYINVCVEHTNYQPISLKQLLNDHGI